MLECKHEWEMENVQFGYVVFERCPHCLNVRTYFSLYTNAMDEFREGECIWKVVEYAQSLKFDLRCRKCGLTESLSDLMGLLYCTECLAECEVMQIQERLRKEKTWPIVAFGYLPEAKTKPFPPRVLDLLTEYFNQRRDVSRSRVKVLPFHLIKQLSQCKGEYIHDVGMLSLKPEVERKHLL